MEDVQEILAFTEGLEPIIELHQQDHQQFLVDVGDNVSTMEACTLVAGHTRWVDVIKVEEEVETEAEAKEEAEETDMEVTVEQEIQGRTKATLRMEELIREASMAMATEMETSMGRMAMEMATATMVVKMEMSMAI